MRLILVALVALAAVCILAPGVSAGPVHSIYDSVSPGPACFAATILVTGEPTCVDPSPLWPAYP
ncbi:MAG: hypothetical protein LC620_03160, partial [Halobacteriales archaeon]|nr:hypothetical protein [Halobacteriales archaeon]